MGIGEQIFNAAEKKTDKNKPASLALGIVKKNWDSSHPGQVQVSIFVEGGNTTLSDWMPVAVPYAANGCGMYVMPEVGSTVVIGYIDDNSVSPVVIGSLWVKVGGSGSSLPSNCANDKNEKKVFCTSNGHMICLNEGDDASSIEMVSAKGLKLRLDDKTQTVAISSGEENQITIDGKNGRVEICAKTSFSVKVGGNDAIAAEKMETSVKSEKLVCDNSTIALKGKQMTLEGSSVSVKAQGNLTVESSGMAQVKGSMLKLN